jgi:hypothetical protein
MHHEVASLATRTVRAAIQTFMWLSFLLGMATFSILSGCMLLGYHIQVSPLSTGHLPYIVFAALFGLTFARAKWGSRFLKFVGMAIILVCYFLFHDIVFTRMEPTQGPHKQMLAEAAANRLGSSPSVAEKNILRYARIHQTVNIEFTITGNNFDHEDAIKIKATNRGDSHAIIHMPAGRFFEPSDQALVQNLVLRSSWKNTIANGSSELFTAYAYCGNQKFDPSPPPHPMRETHLPSTPACSQTKQLYGT